jgi:hypothetical protein
MHNAATTPPAPPARPALNLTRLFWGLITLTIVGLVIGGTPSLFQRLVRGVDERSIQDLGWTVNGYAGYLTALNLLVVFTHLVIGLIVFWRRSRDPMALAVAFALVTNGAWLPLTLMYAEGGAGALPVSLVHVITYLGLVSGLALLFVFPDGHFVPGWTRALAGGWAGLSLLAIFFPASSLSLTRWGVPLQVLALLALAGAGVSAQLYRYRRVSSPLQRQQTKWAILGLSLAVSGPFGYFLPFVIVPALTGPQVPNILYQRVGSALFTFSLLFRLGGLTLFNLALLIFPISFVVAILRYRLWDIDALINRTLVYSAFTGSLALIYLGGVAALQGIFRALTGQGDQLAIVVTTLAIAALSNPLRARIQREIDRRFYRRRYDAAQALAAFSGSVQDEVELEDVSLTLLNAVEDTVQPLQSAIWLRDTRPGG